MSTTNYSLNEEQEAAANHNDGPALVIAGPGSGKTRVLTHRISRLMDSGLASPEEIIAITFTNKAAKEMKERVNTVNKTHSPEWVGTFHSLCAKILRISGHHIGVPRNFNIYDTDDSTLLIKQLMVEGNIDTRKYNPRSVLGSISSAKQELISSTEYKSYVQTSFQEIVYDLYKKYQKSLVSNQALDFSDLIYKTVELFLEEEAILQNYNKRFKYVLVDEYQDTNKSQYEMTKLLAKSHNNLFVVGDMAQAIYSWRGADYRNILNLKRDYKDITTYNLAKNYRSTKTIIEVSKEIIKNNSTNINLELYTDNKTGEKVTIYEAYSEKAEAEFVADSILNSGVDYEKVGVLYRTNALSRNLEDVFMKYGIPYRIVGGFKFYARKEIKDIVSYLKIINNPKDSVSWERIINIPPKGIGTKTFQKVRESGFDLDLIETKSGINFSKLIENKNSKTQDLIKLVLDNTGYLDYLEGLGEEKDKVEARKENIKELSSVAVEFPELESFLEQASLVEETSESEEFTSKVTLMTLHSAKGLEFENVFIVGLEEGIFPHSRSIEEKESLEEERRLCYVGVTRAKKKLYLSYATRRLYFGNMNFNTSSRFISEIPEHLVEQNIGFNQSNITDSKTIDDFFSDVGL